MKTKLPILIVGHKRPETTVKLLYKLSELKPRKLYLAIDGPRNEKESKKVEQVIEVFDSISWDSQINKNYSQKNLGLRKRIVTAIDWALSDEEALLILEDDCIPSASFFKFVQEMLSKYENEEKVLSISGNNFLFDKEYIIKKSYYFSRYFYSWGWATWKKAWQNYDDRMSDWPQKKQDKWLYKLFSDKILAKYWEYIFDQTYKEKIDSWAYRWTYSHFKNNGLSIIPKKNLVKNIGYGKDATHTLLKDKRLDMKTHNLNFPLTHPDRIKRNAITDKITERNVYLSFKNRLIMKIKQFLGT